MKKINLRDLWNLKNKRTIHMLTCYDYPTAFMLNQTDLDLILVGDSLANVVLGFETTIPATLEMMTIFGQAVRKGAPDKFLILDAPFGSYTTMNNGIQNLTQLFKLTQAEAVKLEGASKFHLQLIQRLVESGTPVMGHIGLMPQSVHAQGGYRKHGKTDHEQQLLLQQAKDLEAAGAFAIVLECVEDSIAKKITDIIKIPTIGIGSGKNTDGQVLVFHDLVGLNTKAAPSFVKPMGNILEMEKKIIETYLKNNS